MNKILGSTQAIMFEDKNTHTLEMAKRPKSGNRGRMASQKGRILPVLFL